MGEIFIDGNKPRTYSTYVDERQKENRKEFIGFLEENGYVLDSDEKRSKDDIIDGVLPICVDPVNKEYRMMGSITTAACAAQQKILISKEDFIKSYIK